MLDARLMATNNPMPNDLLIPLSREQTLHLVDVIASRVDDCDLPDCRWPMPTACATCQVDSIILTVLQRELEKAETPRWNAEAFHADENTPAPDIAKGMEIIRSKYPNA